MSIMIRTLLIWLLVMAIPAQGAVISTMAFCGPDHHGGGVATTRVQLAAAVDQTHQSGGAMAHGHRDQSAQAELGSSPSPGSAASAEVNDPSKNSSKNKCSTCASCCSVGAFLGSVLTVPMPVIDPTVFAAVVPSVDAFAVDGPDRPPRMVLA